MTKQKTIEQQVADTILERDVATIEIGGTTYRVAPPSIATLILASEIVSTMPAPALNGGEAGWNDMLKSAKNYRTVGDLAAVLILGAKEAERPIERVTPRLFGLWRRKKTHTEVTTRKTALAEHILQEFTPRQLSDLLVKRINALDLGNFFATTTSLAGANILKPTREVD